MDLDLATDLQHFLEAYEALVEQGFDLVYGSRLHPEAEVIKIAQARLQAQQQAAQQQQATQMAETASKFSPQIQQQVMESAQKALVTAVSEL